MILIGTNYLLHSRLRKLSSYISIHRFQISVLAFAPDCNVDVVYFSKFF